MGKTGLVLSSDLLFLRHTGSHLQSSEVDLGHPWLHNRENSLKRTVEVGACVGSGTNCVRSCYTGLLCSGRRLPYGNRRILVAACHTSDFPKNAMPLEGSMQRQVRAFVAVSGHLFVLHRGVRSLDE